MAAPDLCVLADVKSWLNISTSGSDTLLTALITRASQCMQTWMNVNIWVASYTETRNGNGSDRMIMRNTPITAVTSVTVDGAAIPLSTGPTVSGYVINKDEILLRGYRFNRGYANVVIAYSAGYATSANTVPQDLQQAAIQLCAFWYKERERIGVQSKQLGPENISFTIKSAPDAVQVTMQQYVRVVPV